MMTALEKSERTFRREGKQKVAGRERPKERERPRLSIISVISALREDHAIRPARSCSLGAENYEMADDASMP